MRPYTLLAVIFAMAVIVAVPMISSSSDAAASYVLSGEVTLTEDTVYEDGADITVQPDTSINLQSYTWTIGTGSSITFEGAATIVCDGGAVVVGSGTSFVIFGTVIAGFTSDMTYTFDGTAVFSGVSSQDSPAISFESPDTEAVVSWDHSVLSVRGFMMYQEATGSDIARIIGFSSLTYNASSYDGETLVSTKTVEVVSSNSEKTVVAAIHPSDSADITVTDLPSVTVTDFYPSTNITNVTRMSGLGPSLISIATTSMATIESTADSISVQKSQGSEIESMTVFSGVGIDMDVDIDELFKLVLHGINGSSPDWLSYMYVTAGSASVSDSTYGTEKDLTDLSLQIVADTSVDNYLTVQATDGDDTYTVIASKVTFTSYALSSSLVLDLDASVEDVTVTKKTLGTVSGRAALSGITLETDNLDLKSSYMFYTRTGSLALQHILDNSDKFVLKAGSLSYDGNADGFDEVAAVNPSVTLMKNTRGMYTLTANADSLTAALDVNGETVDMSLVSAGIYMEVSGSLAEVLDALTSGSHFTADAHAEIQMSASSFVASYPLDSGVLSVKAEAASSTSSTDIVVAVSLDHSMYLGATTISGRLSTLGHTLTAEVHSAWTDPEGRLDAVLTTRDITGSFYLEFGEDTTFSANISIPWSLDFYYYGIEFKAVAGNTALSVTRGEVSVDGYDVQTCGILELPFCLTNNDFELECRVFADIPSLTVYTDEGATVHADLSDVEVEVKSIALELKRDDRLDTSLDGISLTYTDSDGEYVEDTLAHLDLTKDLSGKEKEKTLLEEAMKWILVPSIVLCGLFLGLIIDARRKWPELCRFNEDTDNGRRPL